MTILRGDREAFGGPGIEPRWTQGGKEGVGTAYSATSRVWFTFWNGVVTEVYYPTIDRPQARAGNVALTGELIPGDQKEFTLALAFGDGRHSAISTLFQALGIPFAEHHQRYVEQWSRPSKKILPLKKVCCDQGNLYHSSYSLLLAHEDKSYPGAFIASLSIPWGEVKGDEDMGGYHLVWTRDMVNTATALLAAGNKDTPLRALIYLAATQHENGGFSQNFWINGESYWKGIQLDEVAFPILLAWKLHRDNALADFDPYHMVIRAARFLIRSGPATQQERWEEASGSAGRLMNGRVRPTRGPRSRRSGSSSWTFLCQRYSKPRCDSRSFGLNPASGKGVTTRSRRYGLRVRHGMALAHYEVCILDRRDRRGRLFRTVVDVVGEEKARQRSGRIGPRHTQKTSCQRRNQQG